MSVFLDTSALLALLDASAEGHAAASHVWRELLERDETLVTTSYVLVEAFALVQQRLGVAAVRTLAGDVLPVVDVDWVDAEAHAAGLSAFLAASQRGVSLVDCISFEAVRRRGIETVFTLDADFARQGFTVIPRTRGRSFMRDGRGA
jgi:uncharacterized protein